MNTMTTRRPKRLTNLQIREVSSVDRGAGVGVDVKLMKREDDADDLSALVEKGNRALLTSISSINADGSLDIVEKTAAIHESFAQYRRWQAETFAKSDDEIEDEELKDIKGESDDVELHHRRQARIAAEARAARQRRSMRKEEIDMNTMLEVAKSVARGEPTRFTKRDFFLALDEMAQKSKGANESREAAFARYAATPDGMVLMQAHKGAGGPDFEGTRPIEGFRKDTGSQADTPSMTEIKRLTSQRVATEPSKTYEQHFADVYTDPANAGLVAQHKAAMAEQSAIDAAGPLTWMFRPAGSPGRTAERAGTAPSAFMTGAVQP